MIIMQEKVECPVGFVEQSQVDSELRHLRKRETYSEMDGDCDRIYTRFNSTNDQLENCERLSLSSCEPFVEKCVGREDYWRLSPRNLCKTDLSRGQENVWRKWAADNNDVCNCRGCCSRRCSRGSVGDQLCHDGYSPNHFLVNDFQPEIGRLESRRRHISGVYERKWDIDQGCEDNQHRCSDLDYSSDIKNGLSPRRKRGGICKNFLEGQCWRGASCWYVHDAAGRYHRSRSPYKMAKLHGDLFITNKSSAQPKDISDSHTTNHRYKRFIPIDAEYPLKKRRTNSAWRHEESDSSEEGAISKRNLVSRGGYLQVYNKESFEVRRSYQTITEDSSVCKSSDGFLETTESNDVIRRRKYMSRRESSLSNEDSGTECSKVNFNGRRRSRKVNHHSEKQIHGKHLRKGGFHQGTSLKSRDSVYAQKHDRFKRKTDYHPDQKRLHRKVSFTIPCKYYMKGYCHRGNDCLYSHDIGSSPVHTDKRKSSDTKDISVAMPTNELPPGQDLGSTNNPYMSHWKNDRSYGVIDRCNHKKDIHWDKWKKVSGSQEVVDIVTKTCGHQVGKGDGGCANFRRGQSYLKSPKTSGVENIVVDPSLLNLQNPVSEIPSVNLGLCAEVEGSEEILNRHPDVHQSSLSSAMLKHKIILEKQCESTSENSFASNKPRSPSLEYVKGVLDKNAADLNSHSLSSGPQVAASLKVTLSSGVEECSRFPIYVPNTSVENTVRLQPELQENCDSMGEKGTQANPNQPPSSLINDNKGLFQTVSFGATGCSEMVAVEKTLQVVRMHDICVGNDSGVREQVDKNGQINNGLFTSCEVHLSKATMAYADQAGEKMLVCETIPSTSKENTAPSFQMPAIEEALFNDSDLNMSLDHYIYNTLSLEHYISHMEDENKATAFRNTSGEENSLLEDASVVTLENLIQPSNVHLPLPAGDGISEVKPTDLSPSRIAFKVVENSTLNDHLEMDEVQLEPIGPRNTIEEFCLHDNTEPRSYKKDVNLTQSGPSSDKRVDHLCVARASETNPKPILFTSKTSSIKEELGDGPPGFCSRENASLTSKQIQEAVLLLNLKESATIPEAKQNCSEVGCNKNCGVDSKCMEGNKNEDEKFLRIAVLELAKEILRPLWKAGLIQDRNIYTSITKKVVDKVCSSVQGVNIPKTKENADLYLLHHKPKIAQLVLAYVNRYPVQCREKICLT